MERKNTEHLRQKLELQRQQTRLFLRRMEQEARSLDADTTLDSADRSVISVSKESLFERSSERRTVLRLIDAALKRIDDGCYGACLGCGEDIQSRRLEALPWTQFCLECQEELEQEIGFSLSTRSLPSAGEYWKRAG
ncbi:MAG TPA: TraR/DksA C4-type zinc finger protein [Candidatus Sulfotelmatobacter sp.]|nr:TraR/DksA C4-type zinc finger protein [Candidatus Sulfotelmatobacter sp.]